MDIQAVNKRKATLVLERQRCQKQIAATQAQLESLSSELSALDGAFGECEYWLSLLGDKEEYPTLKPLETVEKL